MKKARGSKFKKFIFFDQFGGRDGMMKGGGEVKVKKNYLDFSVF